MKKYLLLICVLPLAVKAQQSNADSIQYEMIKAAVHFYASDTAFKEVEKSTSNCINPEYECLLEFCKLNNLHGVNNKINAWRNINCTSKNQLEALKSRILDEIEANGKGYRTKLPGYNALVTSMASGVAAFTTPVDAIATGDPESKKNPTTKQTVKDDSNRGNTGLITWVALLAGLGGLLLGIASVVKKQKKNPAPADAGNGSKDIDKFESKIAALNTQLPLKADVSAVQAMEQKIAGMETRIKQLEKKPQGDTGVSNNEKVQTQKKPVAAMETAPIFYAKMPDLANGFSNDILRKEQNGEQVYEIAVAGNSAVYSVSSDPGAQHYALNDVNYILERVCTLNNQPFPNCRISTKQKGTLTKTTEGWAIADKAVVDFL
jgi:hypothetical protein